MYTDTKLSENLGCHDTAAYRNPFFSATIFKILFTKKIPSMLKNSRDKERQREYRITALSSEKTRGNWILLFFFPPKVSPISVYLFTHYFEGIRKYLLNVMFHCKPSTLSP